MGCAFLRKRDAVTWSGMVQDGNSTPRRCVYRTVQCLLLTAGLALFVASAVDFYTSARQKIDRIEDGHLLAGARIDLSLAELNAFAAKEVPEGIRYPKLVIEGQDVASGTALVDFGKLRRAQGYETGWLMSKLLDGERPVGATVRIHTGGGKVTVDVLKASISGVEIDGKTIEFLVQSFVTPFYPDAVVGRPVDMGYRIDRLQIAPTGVGVIIGR